MTGREAGIRARLDKATPGPWYVVGPPWNEGAPYINAGSEDPHYESLVCDFFDMRGEDGPSEMQNSEANAALIAHAPADIRWLLEQLDAIRNASASLLTARAWDNQTAIEDAVERLNDLLADAVLAGWVAGGESC